MSRTPVHEALLVLEAQGLVEIRPRRGVRVLPLSARDMEEIYQILTELESLAAAEVAAKGLSRQLLASLEDCLKKMEDALEAEDRTSWAEADAEFHRRLVKPAGNRRLEQVVQMFSDQVQRARLLTLHMRPAPHDSNRDHRALVEAMPRKPAGYTATPGHGLRAYRLATEQARVLAGVADEQARANCANLWAVTICYECGRRRQISVRNNLAIEGFSA